MQYILSLLWAGEILGLAFIATPVKFLAKDLTLSTALQVGHVTFIAQHYVDIFFLIIMGLIGLFYYISGKKISPIELSICALALVIVIFEGWHLLPVLADRSVIIQSGNTPPESWHHTGYIVITFIKMLCGLGLGLRKFIS